MPFSPRKKQQLRETKRSEYCQMCGRKIEGLGNKGPDATHIIANGPEDADNALFLYPNCHQVFDLLLKPAIAKAFHCSNEKCNTGYRAPEIWMEGEGRAGKQDDI
jgi:hypothetical protein